MKVEEEKTAAVSPELIASAAGGDRDAQQRLLESQYGFVRRMLYRLAGPNDLDDLQQTVLLKLLTSLGSFRGRSAFSSWVAGICVNVCKDHWRKRKVRSVMQPLEEEASADEGRQPEADAIHRQRLRQVFSALEELSDNQRSALVLRMAYGHSIDEIATIMKAAKSTTRLRLYYAKKAFAKAMAAREGV